MKEFLSYLKPYKRDAVLAVFCIEAETVFELIIPLVMASIVDVGVATGDRHYILMKGLQMVLFALISLVLGQGSAMFSAPSPWPQRAENMAEPWPSTREIRAKRTICSPFIRI